MISDSLSKKIQIFFMGMFVLLCGAHLFSQRPLWLDEQFVFASLTTYSYEQIFGPLKTQQAFPRLYLSVIKFISEPFQYHLVAVRLLSFIAMLTAFACWMKVYRRLIAHPLMLLIAVLSFVCSYRMVYYSAELKHYSMDVLSVVLYLVFFMLPTQAHKKSSPWFVLGSVCLPFTLFFSYSALFVFWILPLNFLLSKQIRMFWLSFVFALICVLAFYGIDLRYSFRQTGILQYWDSYFLATDSAVHFGGNLFEGMKRLVTYWYGTEKWQYRLAVPFIPFFFYAIFRYGIKALRGDGFRVIRVESLALAIFIELLILGIFKLYPFTGERITLFFAPFVFVLVLKGIDDLDHIQILGKSGRWIKGLFLGYYAAYCLICLGNTAWQFIKLYQ